jgi:acetyl esterase/lipase
MIGGPRRPGWNIFVEVGTEFLKRHLIDVFNSTDVDSARAYLDSVVVSSPACARVSFTDLVQENFRGTWVAQRGSDPATTVLYLHGGGYSFYPRAYSHFVALITLATGAKVFALNYRLAPEYCFPAQLEDSLNAYRWILDCGTKPANLVIAGDSAGGNLALALLLVARDSAMALPSLAVLLSPPADFDTDYPSIEHNAEFDWLDKRMLMQWADWFCGTAERSKPLISPLRADLHGLPPIYIQAGRCEILYDSIKAFADAAQRQGADVVLESWEDMNHIFQMFGDRAPQSAEALRRIGEVIDARFRRAKTV